MADKHSSKINYLASFKSKEESKKYIEKARDLAKKRGFKNTRFSIHPSSEDNKEKGFKHDVFVFESSIVVVTKRKKSSGDKKSRK